MKTINQYQPGTFLVFALKDRFELCKVNEKQGNSYGCFATFLNKTGQVIKKWSSKEKKSVPEICYVPYNLLRTPTKTLLAKVNTYHNSKKSCPKCGYPLVNEEGCDKCLNCGWSSCNL